MPNPKSKHIEEPAHATLSPSSATRWMTCTASVAMEKEFGTEDSSGPAAELGTAVHELIECSWKAKKHPESKKWKSVKFNGMLLGTKEFAKAAIAYEYMLGLDMDGFTVVSERKIPIKATGEFGTVDITAYNKRFDHLIIADYKNGRYPVSPNRNKQMMLYALGAIDELGIRENIETLTVCIIQPESDLEPQEVEVAMTDLLKFEKQVIAARKKIESGNTTFEPSQAACMFCKANAHCKSRAKNSIEALGMDFEAVVTEKVAKPDARVLDPEQVNAILLNMEHIQAFIKDLNKYAYKLAMDNRLPDFKVISKRANRKWADDEAMAQELIRMGYEEDEVYKRSVAGITTVEKLFLFEDELKKFMDKHTIRPEGSPSLVPRNHPGEQITSTKIAADDFCDI